MPPTLKGVIAGDGNVGKTSPIRPWCGGKSGGSRVMPIGVHFQAKVVSPPPGPVKLSIWDVAGQDRFRSLRSGFYRGSRAVALVYDVTESASLANLARWREEINKTVPHGKYVVVGNKRSEEHT